MKNKEKYAKEILKIVRDGSYVAVDKTTGYPVSCNNIRCIGCALANKSGCNRALKEWADSEYVEKPVKGKIMKVHDDYEKIEKHNMDTFQANGMRHRSELMYRCTVCGNLTNLDGSFSQQGHHLICTGCVNKNGGLFTIMKWIYQE